nr:MAG: amino acid ABC transporter permease [Actinomycetota bacterium]
MTTETPSVRPPLWRDVRVLKWLFQLFVFAVVAAIVSWLYGNFQYNSVRSGIPTGFEFLDNPANFTIPDNPLNQLAPVRRALFEGFLNTLRVSLVGIALATVLGVIIGIGRLSTNWLVRRICTVYVEGFRNIPLAILLIFVYFGVVLQALPAIAQAWTPLGLFVFSNRGVGFPWFQGGTPGQLALTVLVGLVAWWLVARWRKRVFDRTGRPSRSGLYGAIIFLVVLAAGWIAFGFSVTLPGVDGRRIIGGIRADPAYVALLIALVLYTASHIAEITRGSIQAVPKGHGGAATALSLSGFQRMWYVILPQAMRIAIPPLGNQYLNLIKNSSLGAGISYFELTMVTRISVANTSPAVPAFTVTLLVYLVISLTTSALVNLANRRFRLVER